MTSTLPVPPMAAAAEPPPPPPPGAAPASRGCSSAAIDDAAWVRPVAVGALLVAHRRPLHLGAGRVRLGQRVLLGRRPGRLGELEGVLLRLVRRGQLDHRRQDARRALDHGALRPDLRRQLVEHPGARGADRRGQRRPAATATVKRWYGPAAGLIAGAVLALTPVAVLMFRFNNPDALLVLLMVAGAWATVRAIENGSTKWLVLAGVFVGFGFLDQDAAGAAGGARVRAGLPDRRPAQARQAHRRSCCSPGSRWSSRPAGTSRSSSWCRRRCGRTSAARRTTACSSWPSATTASAGSPATRPAASAAAAEAAAGAQTGLARMFDSSQGGQISWLLPAALILLVGGLVLTGARGRAPTGSGPG